MTATASGRSNDAERHRYKPDNRARTPAISSSRCVEMRFEPAPLRQEMV